MGSVAIGNESMVNILDDIPIQASNISNGSNYSTPITSPHQTTTTTRAAAAMGDCDQFSIHSSMGNYNTASLFVSPDMILDSSKVTSVLCLRVKEFMFFFFSDHSLKTTMQEYAQANGFNPDKGFQNSMWQLNDQYEISPSSSNSNLREEGELCDDFSQYGCMSPYSVYGNYLGYYGNDMLYEGYD